MYILKQKEGCESVFSDAEFKVLKKAMMQANPLLMDTSVLRDRIAELKEVITAILAQKENCLDKANMFLPTLNFMCRLSGEQEYFFDWEEEEREYFLSNPKKGKHIAIYSSKKRGDTLGLA